jgi:NAD(P)-dependent dehydrogenase (short-subunit alcohol dehydrogenase family)
VAIVTGGGRGIGREYCLMLASQGASVVVNDLGATSRGEGQDIAPAQAVVEEIRAAGGNAIVNGADVSDWRAAKELIDSAVSTFGRLDVLINNAGILRDRMLVSMTESDWDQVIRVHLRGTVAPSHHAASYWRGRSKETGGAPLNARLINTASSSGLYARNLGQSNYSAAKAGIAAFTMVVAQELQRYGVTANAIAPAAVTRLTDNHPDLSDAGRQALSPRWIAPVVAWMASERSGALTGRVIEVVSDVVAIAEGWHRGPKAKVQTDPVAMDPVMTQLLGTARPNAGNDGRDPGQTNG